MGFLSFSLEYYIGKIRQYEQGLLSIAQLYEAKQLLKMLDDLLDEGYTSLVEALEAQYNGVSRLRKVLSENQAVPFVIPKDSKTETLYSQEEYELTTFIDDMIGQAKQRKLQVDNSLLQELKRYGKWIGQEENTAYVFLLRDTLLPYILFKEKAIENIHPWLIGRKTMEALTGQPYVDDDFREAFFTALEAGITDYEDFKSFVKPRMLEVLAKYPLAKKELENLLQRIRADRILVIESGCYGTFPMLLAAIDERVEIRMFTAVPYMYDIYKERIFTKAYEKNRLFETLSAQDELMKFARCENGKFYVQKALSEKVIAQALGEMNMILEE